MDGEGCLEWQKSGLKPPSAVTLGAEQYQRDSDHLTAFLDERCDPEQDGECPARPLYDAYVSWATESGIAEKWRHGQNAFAARMGGLFERKRAGAGSFYRGLRLKTATGRRGLSLVRPPASMDPSDPADWEDEAAM